jgi:hypothetical protein
LSGGDPCDLRGFCGASDGHCNGRTVFDR